MAHSAGSVRDESASPIISMDTDIARLPWMSIGVNRGPRRSTQNKADSLATFSGEARDHTIRGRLAWPESGHCAGFCAEVSA